MSTEIKKLAPVLVVGTVIIVAYALFVRIFALKEG